MLFTYIRQCKKYNCQPLGDIYILPKQPLEDSHREGKLQQDKENIFPQDDLYTIAWETNIGDQLQTRGNEPIPTILPNGEQPVTSNDKPSDADECEVDYITTRDGLHDANDTAQSRSERITDDVNKRNEATEYASNQNSDWPDSAVYPKKGPQRTEKNANVTKENSSKEYDAIHSPIRGMILSCPKYSKMTLEKKI